jgi:FAD:protein FMN transferase
VISSRHDSAVERFAARAMGSALRLVTFGASERDAANAWAAVRTDIELTEACLSRFRADSDLSRLNALTGPARTEAPSRLAAMLTIAWRAQRVTDGRFDARVLERLEELGEHAGVALPPPASGIEPEAHWLQRDGRTRRFRTSQPVDSGGIGKGLGLRWALRAARSAAPAVEGLLLEAGGDLVVAGPGPDEGAWSVGVEDPSGGDRPLAVIRARDIAVTTSSVAVRQWTGPDGQAVHHLIDPRSGDPARGGLQAVTVAHHDPAWAEIWSKALFIGGRGGVGPEGRRRQLAAWWVEEDGSLHMTPAARDLTSWTATEGDTT